MARDPETWWCGLVVLVLIAAPAWAGPVIGCEAPTYDFGEALSGSEVERHVCAAQQWR